MRTQYLERIGKTRRFTNGGGVDPYVGQMGDSMEATQRVAVSKAVEGSDDRLPGRAGGFLAESFSRPFSGGDE